MKFTLVLCFVFLSVAANAANLKCTNGEDELVLEKTSSRKVPYKAKFTHAFYGADCRLISSTSSIKTMECVIEPYWSIFLTVGIVELDVNKKTASIALPITDRRFSTGYRLGKKINLKCAPTTEDAL